MRYPAAPLSLKVLISLFLLFVAVSYVFGLINIYNNSGFTYTGIVVHYRGDIKEMTVPREFAFSRLVQEHHVHLFSLSMLFFLVGWLFTFTVIPEVPKAFFVAAPFVGMLVDFGSLWLTLFASPQFGWFTLTFGAFMALSFFLLIGRPLYEMWILPIWEKKWGEAVPWCLR